MQVNAFYRDVFEDTLGLDVLGLDNRFRDLVKLIDRKTLVTFGNLVPAYYLTYLDLGDRSHIIKKDHNSIGVEYYIDDPILDKFKLPILGIEDVQYNNTGNVDPYDPDSTAYYSALTASRNNITLEGVLFGSEYTYNRTTIDSAIPFKKYKEQRGPRVLYLEHYGYDGTVEIRIKTRWPNVVSIPEEYREDFIKLAKFDVQIKLWNELRYVEDVVTPSGNLNLKISTWESAEKDREDYLKELRLKSMPDRIGPTYFHIL